MTNETCENKSIGLNNIDKIALSSWFGIAGLAAITGNAVVVWLIAKNASLKNSFKYFHNFSGSGGLLRRTHYSSSVDKPLLVLRPI